MKDKIKLTIIEDDPIIGEYIKEYIDRRLDLRDVDVLNKLSEINEKKFLYKDESAFIIDINLGKGAENKGLELIQEIKNINLNSLVIVYSAYPDKEKMALENGADLFFTKGASDFNNTLKSMTKIIKSYAEKESNRFSFIRKKTIFLPFENEKIESKSKENNFQDSINSSYKLLLDGINHEVRNTLLKISHSLVEINEELIDSKINKKKKSKIGNGIVDVKNCISHIDNLLNTYNTFEYEKRKISIHDVINETLQNFQVHYKESITYETECYDSTNQLRCNKLEFISIISNLLSNAIYAVQEKRAIKPEIKIKYEQIKENHIISIQDNGIGIPQKHFDQIYENGFTTSESRKGIGLAIVKNLIETSFRGQIYCDSKLGVGTTFKIKIPKV